MITPPGPDWLPRSPADLFGIDPADPPRLPMRPTAQAGVTVIVPTCQDPTGSRAASLIASLRGVTASAALSGLPVAVLVVADGVPDDCLAAIRRGVAGLGCPFEVAATDPVPAGMASSAARTRNHALTILASQPASSPLRRRYLLFLDDDSAIAAGGAEALVGALEADEAAIAACPLVVPVADLAGWHPPSPGRTSVTVLPGPWRNGHYDLLTVTSHGSLITGRLVGLVVRAEPVLAWVAAGGRLFCPATPRASTEDMLAMATLAKLGRVLSVRQVHAADQARTTPAATRTQQLRWGYDHAWLAAALTGVGLLPPGVRALGWDTSRGWYEAERATDGAFGGAFGGASGVIVNPAQLGTLGRMLSAIAADREAATALCGPDAEDLAEAAAVLTRVLCWWCEGQRAASVRPRPDLPRRVPDDWSSLRDGLDSQLAHVAGNAVGTLRSLDKSGFPRQLLFGLRQRATQPLPQGGE
jgi:hypothetical protein